MGPGNQPEPFPGLRCRTRFSHQVALGGRHAEFGPTEQALASAGIFHENKYKQAD